MRNRLLNYKKDNSSLFFSIFILSNISIFLIYLPIGEFPFNVSIKNIQGQLQQQQTDYIKYQYQSDLIKEFEIPIDNNETGLKGITTDSKDNVWFYYNTNTSSTIIEFNTVNNTFTKYPILKKTNVDNAITNLAGGQIIYDKTRNISME